MFHRTSLLRLLLGGRGVVQIVVLAVTATTGGCSSPARPIRAVPQEVRGKVSTPITTYESPSTKQLLGNKKNKLVNTFKGSIPQGYHDQFVHDPALDVLASLHVLAYRATRNVPARSLDTWVMWKLGVAGIYSGGGAWYGRGEGIRSQLNGAIKEMARELKPDYHYYAFGISRLKIGPAEYVQSVVIVQKPVTVHNVRKFFEPGQSLLLAGKFRVPFDDPRFYIDLSDTEVLEIPIEVDEDGKFMVRTTAPATPGRHFIEVTITDPSDKGFGEWRWHRPVLMLPIYVDVDEPSSPDEMISQPPANPPSEELWALRLLELYNRERAKAGLTRIKLDSGANYVATEQAEEYADNPEAPPDPRLGAKLSGQGLPAGDIASGVSYFEYVDEAAWFHLLSPSTRQALFNEATTTAGIGLARADNYNYSLFQIFLAPREE
ncbi:MAG: hypothetical protein JRF63_13555 [Deltaproteobacteria bacterium]|nr:hypothetical protein [Deltaproteobacteria bacterium]